MAEKTEQNILPYAPKGNLLGILKMIFDRKEPTPLNLTTLEARGIGSATAVLKTLQSLKIIDDKGTLVNRGLEIRKGTEEASKVLKEALEEVYGDIISIDPNIKDSMLGRLTTSLITLRSLLIHNWDFSKIITSVSTRKTITNSKPKVVVQKKSTTKKTTSQTNSVNKVEKEIEVKKNEKNLSLTININLEIQATNDNQVYENFFKAMAKHIGGMLEQ